jgi:glycosyltransferase involved in cell wall biosynthesis
VGKNSDRYLKDLESDNITVTGTVNSTLPYLKHADVALSPLLFEAAGTKFKVLEAAICEIPIVATPVGAEGVPPEYLKYIRVCVESDEFASAILEALKMERKDQLQKFRDYIARDFGLEQLCFEGAEILHRVDLRNYA